MSYKYDHDHNGVLKRRDIVCDTITATSSSTGPSSIGTSELADNAVTYAKMQNVSATDKILGRASAGAGDPEEIACTAAGRALLDDATAAAQLATLGAAASGANTDITSVYLNNTGLKVKDTNASHGLIIAPGSDLTADHTLTFTTGDADRTLTMTGDASITGTNTGDQTISLTGDVTGSGTGSFAATIANDAVSYAKMQNVSAADRILGRSTAGAGDVEEITVGGDLTQSGSTFTIANNAVTSAKIATGAVLPSKMAVNVRNESGGDLLAGDLVYLSSWSEANTAFIASKADADLVGAMAQYIITGTIANNTNGVAYKTMRLTGLNTGGSAVGDNVYLSKTEGGWTLVEPTDFDAVSQIVGRVAVVDGAIGEIEFDLTSLNVRAIGNNEIHNNAITTDKLGDGQVTALKTADAAGLAGLYVEKMALCVYDFDVNGGTVGVINLTNPTIPDNAVVAIDSYDVLTTLTSAGDTATLALGFPTDGDVSAAIAINAGSNPWDQGIFYGSAGALLNNTPKKLTAARVPQVTVGVENITAGKVVFKLKYWISQ